MPMEFLLSPPNSRLSTKHVNENNPGKLSGMNTCGLTPLLVVLMLSPLDLIVFGDQDVPISFACECIDAVKSLMRVQSLAQPRVEVEILIIGNKLIVNFSVNQ